jgi:hypothetical protein
MWVTDNPSTMPMQNHDTHAVRLPTDLHRATCEVDALNEIAGGVGGDRNATGCAGECASLIYAPIALIKQRVGNLVVAFVPCVRLRFYADLCHCVFPLLVAGLILTTFAWLSCNAICLIASAWCGVSLIFGMVSPLLLVAR